MTTGERWRWGLAGTALLSAIALALSAWVFAARHAIALPMSDAWDFIATFIEPVSVRGLSWVDLFVQRGGVDHSQPLQKLVLYAHWRLADLDFRIEALVGQLFSAVVLGGLCMALFQGPPRAWTGPAACRSSLILAVASAVVALALFSMNSTEPLTWSLVSLGWMYIALSLAAWWLWLSPRRQRWSWLSMMASSAMLVLAFDEAGMVSVLAGILAMLAMRWKPQGPAMAAVAALVVGAALGRLVLESIAPSQPMASPSLLDALRRAVDDGSWTALVEAPLLGGWIHRTHWPLFGLDQAPLIRGALTVLVALLHLGFWWFVARKALTTTPPSRRLGIAVAVMLFSYGCWAGAVVARVPEFGVDYLWQPRYLMFFQLQWAAFALAWTEAVLAAPAGHRPAGRIANAGLVLGLVLLASQVPMQMQGWATGPYVDRYAQGIADGMRVLAANPGGTSPSTCPAMLTPCGKPPSERDALIGFLVEHRLSLFSPAFLERHPELDLPPDCAVKLKDWGPRQVLSGEGFNIQPDGRSAFWISFDAPLSSSVTLEADGRPVVFDQSGAVVTFLSDAAIAAALEADGLLTLSVRCAGAEVATAHVRLQARP